jgi:hypothetical protein
MSRFGLAATVLIALASAACSNSGRTQYSFVAPVRGDPAVAFADRECTENTTTGRGLGYHRCLDQMEQVARAGGAPYVAALRTD